MTKGCFAQRTENLSLNYTDRTGDSYTATSAARNSYYQQSSSSMKCHLNTKYSAVISEVRPYTALMLQWATSHIELHLNSHSGTVYLWQINHLDCRPVSVESRGFTASHAIKK